MKIGRDGGDQGHSLIGSLLSPPTTAPGVDAPGAGGPRSPIPLSFNTIREVPGFLPSSIRVKSAYLLPDL